jgi:hypothetical protein
MLSDSHFKYKRPKTNLVVGGELKGHVHSWQRYWETTKQQTMLFLVEQY